MIFISHRGNLFGSNVERENTEDYINEALVSGYNVEIDVWYFPEEREYWLGHDEPKNKTTIEFLKQHGLWCHCKNLEALIKLNVLGVHCFSHKNDDYSLTSKGYIWEHSHGNKFGTGIIYACPEILGITKLQLRNCAGICSDYIDEYRKA